MQKLSFLILSIVFMMASAQAQTWNADKSHSTIGFEATHMVISTVDGKFTDYEVTVESSEEDFSDAKINFTADVASIDTDNEKRDGHLKSDDFFNAEEHPKMTFESTSFKKTGKDKYKLKGDLTIRGTTKPIELEVTHGGTVVDPWGNTRAGFKARGTINRFDYGLKWNTALESGGLVVDEEVDIVIAIELVKS